MSRAKMIEVEGERFLRLGGVRRLYIVREGEEMIFSDDDWCLLVKGSRRKTWASIRVFRLFYGVRAYSAGVNTRTWRPSRSDGAAALEKDYPGVLAWAAKATMQFLTEKRIAIPPAVAKMRELPLGEEAARPVREATREEERKIADLVRARQGSRPLSQHRVAKSSMRYLGDEAEAALNIPEETAFVATKRLIGMGVLEDVMFDRKTKLRGLKVIESAYLERFAGLIEGETVDAQ